MIQVHKCEGFVELPFKRLERQYPGHLIIRAASHVDTADEAEAEPGL